VPYFYRKFAGQAAQMISREASERLEILRQADLATAIREERTRIAREIHDGLAQDLWLAKLRLDSVAATSSLDDARAAAAAAGQIISRSLSDVREAMVALRIDGRTTDLEGILRRCAESFTDATGLPVELNVQDPVPELLPRAALELSRIVGEALANVRKHANATWVRLDVDSDDRWIHTAISDNGMGFRGEVRARGIGLTSMRERAAVVGGRLRIESEPAAGTTVIVDIPRRAA
jgi:signal transduction histidine kinase